MFLQKKYLILFAATVVAFTLYCYNPFELYFLNDDFIHIPLSRDGILLQHNSFRPVCDLSMMLDYQLWGKTAWGYHLTNLLLHIINTILVFYLSKNLCRKYSRVHRGFPNVSPDWRECFIFTGCSLKPGLARANYLINK